MSGIQAALVALLTSALLAACGTAAPSRPEAAEPTQDVSASTPAARLVSPLRARSYDADGNGLWEALTVDVDVDVARADTFAFDATLARADGRVITTGSLQPDFTRDARIVSADLDAGRHTETLYFNGAALRAAAMDGTYVVQVRLVDSGGTTLDSAIFTTQPYTSRQFQGPLVTVGRVSDQGIDKEALAGFDILRVTAEVTLAAAGMMEVQGQLYRGDTSLGNVTYTVRLEAGAQRLVLDFAGAKIAASRVDGPYEVALSVADTYYTANARHTTAAYRAAMFKQP